MSVKRVLFVLSAISVLVCGSAGGIAAYGWRALNTPLNITDSPIRIVVESGSTLSRVGNELAQSGVLEHPRLFAWFGRLSGSATDIKVGEFDVPRDTTPVQLLELLVNGDVVQYSFTIVEGWRFSEMIAALREHEGALETYCSLQRPAVLCSALHE